MSQPPKINDDDFRALSKLGRIGDEQAFRSSLGTVLYFAFRAQERTKQGRRARKVVKDGAEAANALHRCIAELSPGEVEDLVQCMRFLKIYRPVKEVFPEGLDFPEIRLATFAIACGFGAMSGRHELPRLVPGEKKRGRKPGSVGSHAFHQLVTGLRQAALDTGGQFTFDSNRGTGSLITALELLRSYLPDSVPKSLPISTIKRILRSQRAKASNSGISDPRRATNSE